MNKEQLAALTELEQTRWKKAQGHEYLPSPWLREAITALADARLELQEAKDSRDGFACDLDASEAEVARLTEEREQLQQAFDHADAKCVGLARQVSDFFAVRDQQRRDIRRLMALSRKVLAWIPDNDHRRELVLRLADLREKYPKEGE